MPGSCTKPVLLYLFAASVGGPSAWGRCNRERWGEYRCGDPQPKGQQRWWVALSLPILWGDSSKGHSAGSLRGPSVGLGPVACDSRLLSSAHSPGLPLHPPLTPASQINLSSSLHLSPCLRPYLWEPKSGQTPVISKRVTHALTRAAAGRPERMGSMRTRRPHSCVKGRQRRKGEFS